jgi:hypothetical protein
MLAAPGGARILASEIQIGQSRMDDAASRYARVLADQAKAGLRVVVIESRDEELVTVKTTRGIHVFTVGRELALEVGLLKRSPETPKQ